MLSNVNRGVRSFHSSFRSPSPSLRGSPAEHKAEIARLEGGDGDPQPLMIQSVEQSPAKEPPPPRPRDLGAARRMDFTHNRVAPEDPAMYLAFNSIGQL